MNNPMYSLLFVTSLFFCSAINATFNPYSQMLPVKTPQLTPGKYILHQPIKSPMQYYHSHYSLLAMMHSLINGLHIMRKSLSHSMR